MTNQRDMKQPETIRVSDVSALPEADREVIARFEAALHGARPAPGSDEAAAVAAMNRFVDDLRIVDELRIVHWFYPSATIGCGCGLLIDDLRAAELTCLRSEVTCSGCLERLRSDRGICEACRLGSPNKVSADLAPPHMCDPGLRARPH